MNSQLQAAILLLCPYIYYIHSQSQGRFIRENVCKKSFKYIPMNRIFFFFFLSTVKCTSCTMYNLYFITLYNQFPHNGVCLKKTIRFPSSQDCYHYNVYNKLLLNARTESVRKCIILCTNTSYTTTAIVRVHVGPGEHCSYIAFYT